MPLLKKVKIVFGEYGVVHGKLDVGANKCFIYILTPLLRWKILIILSRRLKIWGFPLNFFVQAVIRI